MLLDGGELDGVRVLKESSVDEMTKDQVGDAYQVEGRGFGLGLEVVQEEGSWGSFPPGSYGWGGAYGSRYVVVPRDRVVIVVLIQLLPNTSDIREVVPELLYQAVARPED
jgi:CubicO group peptidase (beta-lactamase class C family)